TPRPCGEVGAAGARLVGPVRLGDPHRDRARRAGELGPAFAVGGHGALDVPRGVPVRAARAGRLHAAGAGVAAADHHGHAAGVLLVAGAHPADAPGVVEVVPLLAVGQVASHAQEPIDEPAVAGQDDLVLLAVAAGAHVLGAVVVAEEDDRVAALAQEDQRVGERHEPGLHHGLVRLERLGVVVRDQGDRPGG